MTEGTTRLLDTPERQNPFDLNSHEHPGSLAKATNRLPLQTDQTSRSLETKDKNRQGVLISSLLVATLMLAALVIVLWSRSSGTTAVSPPVVIRPDIPPIQLPPPPPLPPQGGLQGSKINPELIYPGAQKTMEITNAADRNMLQLQTSDSFDKVVNWYTGKLKPKSVVKQLNEQSQSVVLATGEVAAIITANGAGTTIMLTQGDE